MLSAGEDMYTYCTFGNFNFYQRYLLTHIAPKIYIQVLRNFSTIRIC